MAMRIARGNDHLDVALAHRGPNQRFITDDEVQRLATLDNPDAAGTNPSWLSGPAPVNFWKVHFARSLAMPSQHGRIHIMVVNTAEQFSLHDISGMHWITVGWVIEPDEEANGAAAPMPTPEPSGAPSGSAPAPAPSGPPSAD